VTTDAYPDRPFTGIVEKIEPQAVVQQSVTMFPVLVSLENREGLLKPGMNGEVSMLIDERTNVLSVPNDAVRNTREAALTAQMLGLNADSVMKEIQAQRSSQFQGAMNGGGDGAVAPTPPAVNVAKGEVDLKQDPQQGGRRQGAPGQMGQMPEVSDKDCAAVTAAFAKHPDARAKLDGLRGRVQSGELDFQGMREESQKIYASIGVDARIAGACRFRERQQQQGGAPATTGAPGQPNVASGAEQQRRGERAAGGAAAPSATNAQGRAPRVTIEPQGEQSGGMFGANRGRRRQGLVFVKEGETFHPRLVTLGVSNFDYTEVVSGVKEGEQVALLASAAMQMQRDLSNERFRNMTGGGVPGMSKSTTTPGGAAGAAGGQGGGGGRLPPGMRP
jgi:HlyD family secretion protein